ncbi:polysaccharide deacetylase family protein [Paenibacillus sp. N1-5-1-14]|uniref:polysaccharide deacetylase family protein n=1 Tax=Paenibacillus radicibacter TaxID=2972488 RepID=UPI002159A534|nr:polysaccharide deacetylase family protein [Paenibacillus radicibacter]MCR8643355.1 polysaccharide deacetylase family protein [Paenibacillus radicibacter]
MSVLQLVVLGIVLYMLIPFVITRICGLVVIRRGKAARQVAFTFDDGPNPTYTPRLLDLLHVHGVKATFFVLGKEAEKYPDVIRRMHQEGHQIGIHNYTHTSNWIMTPGEIKRGQIDITADILERITGERPTFYRPPWGLLNLGDLFNYHLRSTYRIVLWSVIVGDWKRSTTAERLRSKLLGRIKPGAIVVLHDSGKTLGADADAPLQMIAGLDAVLMEVHQQGYSCVRVDEMLEPSERDRYREGTSTTKKSYKSSVMR